MEERNVKYKTEGKKPYVKPTFEFERVFEVNSLACTVKGPGACTGSTNLRTS